MYILRLHNLEKERFIQSLFHFDQYRIYLIYLPFSKFSKRSIKRSKSTRSVYLDQKKHRAIRVYEGKPEERKKEREKMKSALTRGIV